MRKLFQRLVAACLGVGLVPIPVVHAQALAELLKGRWVFEGQDCKAAIALRLEGSVLRWTDAAGHVDMQRVTSQRSTGIATQTTASTHGQPIGTAWVYEILAPGQISLTEASTGKSADLARCPDMLPANSTPRQIVEALYARYAASDEPNLPLSGEANVQAFFVAGLAHDITAFASRSGKLPDDCKPEEPFVPGSFGDYKVTGVHVDLPPVPDGADRETANVSFSNFGKPASVSIMLDRTPDGWRIADVSPAPGHSFRASMAACAAPPK